MGRGREGGFPVRGLWIFWAILKCPEGIHTHRADLNIPGNGPGWKREWGVRWGPAWPLCATVWNNCQFRPFNASLRDMLTGRAFEGHLAHISLYPSRPHQMFLGRTHVFTLCFFGTREGKKRGFLSELDEKARESLASGVAGSSSLMCLQTQVSGYLFALLPP